MNEILKPNFHLIEKFHFIKIQINLIHDCVSQNKQSFTDS